LRKGIKKEEKNRKEKRDGRRRDGGSGRWKEKCIGNSEF